MKVSRMQLRKLIKEAIEPISVKTVSQDEYEPQAAWNDTSPRSEESPKRKDRVGNFFMIKLGKQPKGYGSLRKRRYFYMILPDGEAIGIGSMPDMTDSEGRVYLTQLNDNVTPLPISDYSDPTDADNINRDIMRDAVTAVQNAYIEIREA